MDTDSPTETFSGAVVLTSSFGSRTMTLTADEPVKVTQAWQSNSPLAGGTNFIFTDLSCLEESEPRSQRRTSSVPSACGSVPATLAPLGTLTCRISLWRVMEPSLVAESVYSAGAPTLRVVGPNHSRQTVGSCRATAPPIGFVSSVGSAFGIKTVGFTSPGEVVLTSARLTPSASGLPAGLRIAGTGGTNGSSADFGRGASLVGRGSGRSALTGLSGIGGSGSTIGREEGRVWALPSVAQPTRPIPTTNTPATAWNGRMSPSPIPADDLDTSVGRLPSFPDKRQVQSRCERYTVCVHHSPNLRD